ncbi:MAG: biotin--[acetyl-CoA-carboxylase] ligase [Desulfobacula sp.]|jgi:BirA family transcriptional regulator, biotin operon repressor / biotin---[acetyl-CoA-carboxylase] ligase|uniref:biotin--[acetyl-CoA-carboxylase] ligase n=1 Tax=Desulfobacula sp. TaxID=2593537 RepID=UPI001D5F4A2C|nr:biotin--[acetyl-CoA-carboxylase] ligase [Desulfobacula sp.]MBT3803022.1 biotin--[acetyl-CoA-carboxylase] ligase [Desulfobacula sp.]MBT4023465.1 biotin--[acetyl-CoA-carboxylase] ligase [Desulfobacula sp.]MBT4197070.1 biotin--[acetyl-CoA-carboxylase] ligase [Desulfobacula sp.]MBT5544334.1 biotin--[acetyl-CoA-carboxylase] ligase [Desulfobacula sp.]
MVNEQKNIKDNILKLLYQVKGKIISGVKLSQVLNISRVAVWKHIKALKESGFDIESRPKGYVLLNHEDLLLPFCFKKEFQKKIFHFQELESTMDKAKFLAKNKALHLSVVIAENQTTGRGRLNRKWFSSKGGLWFTLILKPKAPPQLSYIYNFAASLSLSRSLRQLFGVDVSVKWPNDILLNGKKLVGLLSEMETRGDMVEYLNIGIGINVNNQPQKNEPKAISLKDVLHKNLSRRLILETFLENFKNQIQTIDCHRIIELWKKQTSTIGSHVRIETLTDAYEGLAIDVDEAGTLIIKDNKGKIKKIIYGDCFHT